MLAGKPFISCTAPNWVLRGEIVGFIRHCWFYQTSVTKRKWWPSAESSHGMDAQSSQAVFGVPWVLCPRDLWREKARGAEKELSEDPQGLGICNCEGCWVKALGQQGQHRCWAAWVICPYSSYREVGSSWCKWVLWMFSSLFWKCYLPFHWNPGHSFCFMQYLDFVGHWVSICLWA